MFVLCCVVLCCTVRRKVKPGQSGQSNTDKVQRENKQRIPPEDMYACLECYSQVEVSATGRSLFRRSPPSCGVLICVCDLETSKNRRPWPTLGCCIRQRGFRVYLSFQMGTFQCILSPICVKFNTFLQTAFPLL
jgi:hypothetical protein